MDAGVIGMGVVAVNPHEIEFLASEVVAKSLVSNVHGDNNVTIFPGTLRDYFAGQALAGLVASGMMLGEARLCYRFADAMLKAREES